MGGVVWPEFRRLYGVKIRKGPENFDPRARVETAVFTPL